MMPDDDGPDRSFPAGILKLAWPAALQNLLQSAMFFVDTAIIGRLPAEPGGAQPLAAMQLVGPVVWSAATIASFFAVGTTAIVARAAGERDLAKARRATSVSLRLALAVGAAAGVIGILAAPWLAAFYGGSAARPETRADAALFLQIFAAGFPVHLAVLVMMSALRGAGDTRGPMAAGILANAVNAAGNLVLIHGWGPFPRMGVPGAAAATLVALCLEAVWLFWILSRAPARSGTAGSFTLTLSARDSLRWDPATARAVMTVSLPSLAEAAISHSAFLTYQYAINALSETAMAAQRIAITWESLAFMPAWGLYVGAATFCGQKLGEKRPDLAERGVRRAAAWGAGIFLLLSVPFVTVPGFLARLVADVPGAGGAEVIDLAATCLAIGALEVPLIGASMALYGGLRGAGETKGPLLVSFIGGWCVRVPLAWLFGHTLGWGLAGIWLCTVIDWGTRTALYAWLLARGRWKQIKL